MPTSQLKLSIEPPSPGQPSVSWEACLHIIYFPPFPTQSLTFHGSGFGFYKSFVGDFSVRSFFCISRWFDFLFDPSRSSSRCAVLVLDSWPLLPALLACISKYSHLCWSALTLSVLCVSGLVSRSGRIVCRKGPGFSLAQHIMTSGMTGQERVGNTKQRENSY